MDNQFRDKPNSQNIEHLKLLIYGRVVKHNFLLEFSKSLKSRGGENYYFQPYIYTGFLKRLFDIVLALVMLAMVAPLLLFLLAFIAFDGGRPLFTHTRIGQHGRPFRCLKLRSMRNGAEAALADVLSRDPVSAAEWAANHKLTNDPRVTRIGAFLRKSSLDELPQLVNVLRGDMSIVGPRPVTAAELVRYGPWVDSYLKLKPGLTGPWQVDGRNNAMSYDERVELDVRYANAHDFIGDLRIILKTGLAVVRLKGA